MGVVPCIVVYDNCPITHTCNLVTIIPPTQDLRIPLGILFEPVVCLSVIVFDQDWAIIPSLRVYDWRMAICFSTHKSGMKYYSRTGWKYHYEYKTTGETSNIILRFLFRSLSFWRLLFVLLRFIFIGHSLFAGRFWLRNIWCSNLYWLWGWYFLIFFAICEGLPNALHGKIKELTDCNGGDDTDCWS